MFKINRILPAPTNTREMYKTREYKRLKLCHKRTKMKEENEEQISISESMHLIPILLSEDK